MKDKIDLNKVRDMYNNMNEIWPEDDKWYQYTHSQIDYFLQKISSKHKFMNNTIILNAGSGGNTYKIPGIHYHIDIAEQKIKNLPNSCVGTIEELPYTDEFFDVCICVGSVINYCDAFVAIGEMARVLKKDGLFILDYDQSHSFEFLGTSHYNKTADIIETFNSGYVDRTWIYSHKYISNILKRFHFNILDTHYYHTLSPLVYRITHNETKAASFAKCDKCLSRIPIINKLSCNIILCAQKT